MEVVQLTYPVKCPVCNQRVFDIVDGMQGCIEYKCPRCKKVSRYAKLGEVKEAPVHKTHHSESA